MYLEIDEGFLGHRKTLRMCALLGDQGAAVYLLRLWTWACRSCRDGNLRGIAPAEIEMAVQYHAADGKCYAAMAEAGYIDQEDGRPAKIHGWTERTGAALRKMEAKAAENRQRRAAARTKHEGKKGRNRTRIVPESYQYDTARVPTQTRPDQTSPVQDPEPPSGSSPSLSASGSGATPVPAQSFGEAARGPILPTTGDRLVHCLKVEMERVRPDRGMYAAGPFAARDADELLGMVGNGPAAATEMQRRIGLFVADDGMNPWTVARFCKVYNGIGAPKSSGRRGTVAEGW